MCPWLILCITCSGLSFTGAEICGRRTVAVLPLVVGESTFAACLHAKKFPGHAKKEERHKFLARDSQRRGGLSACSVPVPDLTDRGHSVWRAMEDDKGDLCRKYSPHMTTALHFCETKPSNDFFSFAHIRYRGCAAQSIFEARNLLRRTDATFHLTAQFDTTRSDCARSIGSGPLCLPLHFVHTSFPDHHQL